MMTPVGHLHWCSGGGGGGVPRVILYACFLRSLSAAADRTSDPYDADDPSSSDWSDDADDPTFDWSIDEDEDDDDADDQRLVYGAGEMTALFAKLNALRRRRREDVLQKICESSAAPPPRESTPRRDPPSEGCGGGDPLRGLLLSPDATDRDQKSGWPTADSYLGTDDDEGLVIRTDGPPPPVGVRRPAAGVTGRSPRVRLSPRLSRAVGHLHMGWNSVRCVWRRYNGTAAGQESAREWLGAAARFWAAVIGVSVAVLWSVFGSFHAALCVGVAAPPSEYARDVNRYLTTVPPHVVVTGRGKAFRYEPTAEERFLWRSAKTIANFKI